jgi:hypothetical protein
MSLFSVCAKEEGHHQHKQAKLVSQLVAQLAEGEGQEVEACQRQDQEFEAHGHEFVRRTENAEHELLLDANEIVANDSQVAPEVANRAETVKFLSLKLIINY